MKEALKELNFCLKLWEQQGYCSFGGKTNCAECGCPYVLYKMCTGKVLHDGARLSLDAWKKLVGKIVVSSSVSCE
jgi:hypothetical protein